jgi:hypothetical protein
MLPACEPPEGSVRAGIKVPLTIARDMINHLIAAEADHSILNNFPTQATVLRGKPFF